MREFVQEDLIPHACRYKTCICVTHSYFGMLLLTVSKQLRMLYLVVVVVAVVQTLRSVIVYVVAEGMNFCL